MARHRTRVLHVTSGLSAGGAESMLFNLLSARNQAEFEHSVVTLKDRGFFAHRIESLSVPVHAANMASVWSLPRALWHVRRVASVFDPHVIQGWMYHGNIAALLASRSAPVVWNIRHSIYDLADEKRMTARVIRLGARLSWRASGIVYNSITSARQHESIGYSAAERIVIPNGFDCERFKPQPSARDRVRRDLGVDEDTVLVGMVARYHPMKDHASFVAAAETFARGTGSTTTLWS